MSIKKLNDADLFTANKTNRTVLTDYLEKSGLSLWVSKDMNLNKVSETFDLIEDPDQDSGILTLHNCGCNGGSCNASC